MYDNRVRKRCPHCGHTYTVYIYGYVEDPLGIPFSTCPSCYEAVPERSHKEWIQMSPLKKYFAIYPRGWAMAFFPSLAVSVLLMFLYLKVMSLFGGISPNSGAGGFGIFLLFFGYWLTLHLFIQMRANSAKFLDGLIASLRRSRNPEYRAILEKMGRIYDEQMPRLIRLSQKSQDRILTEMAKKPREDKVVFPEMRDNVHNSI